MKRDGILFIIIIGLIIIAHNGFLGLFSLLFGTIGLYVSTIILLKVLSGFFGDAKKEKFTKIIDLVELRKPITYDTFSIGTRIAELQAFNDIGESYLSITQNHRLFAAYIGAIPASYTAPMPDHLAFVSSKKILYELRRKHGESYSANLPKPSLTKADVLRRLEEGEVLAFHEFCRKNPLCG